MRGRLLLNFLAVAVLTVVCAKSKGKRFSLITVGITLSLLLLVCKPWHSDHFNPAIDVQNLLDGQLTLAQWCALVAVQFSAVIAARAFMQSVTE